MTVVPPGLEAAAVATSARLVDDVAATVRPEGGELLAWFDAYARDHRRRLAEDLELAARHFEPGARVLDVGAVPLLLTGALARRGYAVTGVDLDPGRFGPGADRLGLEVVRCDVERERLPWPAESFDGVVCNEVLEHLRVNPLFTLRELSRVLRPGGVLLLSTPNLSSFRGVVNLLRHGRAWAVGADPVVEFAKLETVGHMGHVREYTRREVTGLLGGCGLVVRAVVPRGQPASRVERAVIRWWPAVLPMMSVVAVPVGGGGAAGSAGPTDPTSNGAVGRASGPPS